MRVVVEGEKKERWIQLCELAASEQDSATLLKVVKEINNLLEEKEQRLQRQPEHCQVKGSIGR